MCTLLVYPFSTFVLIIIYNVVLWLNPILRKHLLMPNSFLFTVPTPTVTIVSPRDSTAYAGSRFILHCTIQLNQTVDSPVTFLVFWRRSGVLILNDTRTTVYNVAQSGSHTYLSMVVFSTLSLTQDSGQYTCEASVSASPPSPYITGSFSATSTAYSLTIERPSKLFKTWQAPPPRQ